MKDSMGMTKAAVFPEPVHYINIMINDRTYKVPVSAIPMISLFCKPIGMA
jgi:hypothetical protein